MGVVAVWLVAYLAAGFIHVRRDVRQPPYNQPGYVRSFGLRWLVRLLWPIALWRGMFFMGRIDPKSARTEAVPDVAMFLAVGVIGTWAISN